MTSQPYSLVFTGHFAPGQVRAAVQPRLAELYKRPVAELDPMFGGGERVIKRGARAEDLERLHAAFSAAGAEVEIRGPEPAPAGVAGAAGIAPAAEVAEAAPRSRYSIDEFVAASRQRDHGQGLFELEHSRLLEVNLAGMVWMKMGAMVAYRGNVKFTREGLLDKGLGKLLKRSVSGEGAQLSRADGNGVVYLADTGKKITILALSDEAIFVNGNDVLALEASVEWDVRMMRKVTAMLAGGLFNMHLSGRGLVAVTTHYDPLTLEVTPDNPVFTDPNATVAWSASLEPKFRTDVSFKTFLGRGSGESIQMQFEGRGFVVVQPYEELYLQRG